MPDARLSNYRLERLLGSGGMGSVYLARDLALDRPVAIKFISPEKAGDEGARRRLIREARAAAALDHPNICAVHQVIVEADGRACIVMQYVEGETLAERLRSGPLEARLALSVACDLAEALSAAHKRGIIHRDLKPQNVIVTNDRRAKLLDFGIARVSELPSTTSGDDTATSLTVPGMFVGTPPYMSPEQFQQRPLDGRSDLFSLGALFFECLTGRRAFEGPSQIEFFTQVLNDHPPPVSAVRPELTDRYDEVCRRLLAKHPDDRFRSAEELLGALRVLAPDTAGSKRDQAVISGKVVSARGRRLGPRHLMWTLGVVAIAAVAWMPWRTSEPFRGAILVADFEDRAGEADLVEAIRAGLTVKLQQSHALHVLSREQVIEGLNRMDRGGDRKLDMATAVELCQREGIPLLLAGTVYKRGDVMWLTVTASDPMSRAGKFSETIEFRSAGDVFSGLDALAASVRSELGESLSGIAQSNAPLDQVTTPSVDALKLYTRARERHVRGDADAAVPLLTQALQIDPGFAMAHRLMARVYETRGRADKAREHFEQAYAFRDSLTQKERFQVEASFFKGRGEYEKAVDTLIAATNLFPKDGETRYDLALAYRDAGETAKSIEQLEMTVSNAPLTTAAYSELVLLRARTGDYSRARGAYQSARQREINAPKLEWAFGMVLLGEGRTEEARAQFSGVAGSSSVYAGTARLYLATADILDGKLQSAVRQLELDVLLDKRDSNELAEFIRRDLLARTLLLQDQRAAAARELGANLSLLRAQPPGARPHERLVTGTLLVTTGDVPAARALLAQFGKEPPGAFAQSCYHSLEGEIALAEGRPTDAVLAFSTAAARYPRVATTRAMARAFTRLSDWSRARTEWERVIAAKGEALREHLSAEWVLAHLELARVHRAAGDIDAARAGYDTFLKLWAGADDVPARRAAEAERRSLPAPAS